MYGGAHIVPESGERQAFREHTAARGLLRLEHAHLVAGARQ
jgi:hypothetical protein